MARADVRTVALPGAVALSDTGRAVAFSDSVFAIIITLLVLDLHPPRVEPGRLLVGLLEQWPTYLAYVTSYLYVAVVWLNHYLDRHPTLHQENVPERFFDREFTRAWAGIVLYVTAGLLGYLVAPPIALVVFLAVPLFYGMTSHGLDGLRAVKRLR